MGFAIVQRSLLVAVTSPAGTVDLAYPVGYNQADFIGDRASPTSYLMIDFNDRYEEADDEFDISYGASTITLTNKTGYTWAAKLMLSVQLENLDLDDTTHDTIDTLRDVDYLVKTANSDLTAERAVTDTASITVDWSTSGQAKFNVAAAVLADIATGVAGAVAGIALADDDILVRTATGALSAERVVTDSPTLVADWSVAGQVSFNVLGTGGGSAGAQVDYKDSVALAATGNVTRSGEQTIDGTLTSATDVLLPLQTNGAQNGVYTTGAGAWTRRTDADISAEVTTGMRVYVEGGAVNAGLVYVLKTPGPITLDTTVLSFQAEPIPASAFTYAVVGNTTRNLVATDVGKRLAFTHASTKTYTLLANSVIPIQVNAEIELYNAGAGLLTVVASGTTINAGGGDLTIPQGYSGKLKKRQNANIWDLTLNAGLKPNVSANLTVGYTATAFPAGTKSSGTFTPDPANGGFQTCTNGGAFTLAPPSVGTGDSTSMQLKITNNGSAGAITTSGFTKVNGSFDTTNGHIFFCTMEVIAGTSELTIRNEF